MSPIDWIMAACAGASCAVSVGVTIYNRGKLDGYAKTSSDAIMAIKAKLEEIERARDAEAEQRGGQAERNRNADAMSHKLDQTDRLAINLNARVTAHEKGCEQRQVAIEKKFDQTVEAIEHLRAEVRNLALGLANQPSEGPAGHPTRRRL